MHGPVAGIGEKAHPIGLGPVGRPHLAAIDDVVAALLACPRLDARNIGARADLGDAEAGDIVAADAWFQKFIAELIGAVLGERRRRHVRLHADRHGDGPAARSAERLAEGDLVGIIETEPAELLGLVDPEEALIAHLLEDLMRREDAGLLPFIDERVDLRLAEFGDRAHELAMLFGIDRGHGISWRYIRATPKLEGLRGRISASRQIERQKARTLRESRGSMRPSSQSRAVANSAVDSRSN